MCPLLEKGKERVNVLPTEKRLDVLAALVNGNGIRATERITGVHRDTIMRFGAMIGEGCARLHDRLARDLQCPLVDIDEHHSWCGVREIHLDPAKHDRAIVGEQWTWAAICRTSKLVIAWHVGKRDQASADVLVADVRARLVVMPQITTDGLKLYPKPIGINFGFGVDYMQQVKNFSKRPGRTPESEKSTPGSTEPFIDKKRIFGTPDRDKATTYAIERNNCTARQWNARLRRRTLNFSKRLDRHCAAISLHYVYQNLCHIPRNMRETAAMAAGITDKVWSLAELLEAALSEPAGEKPTPKPLAYRKPETICRELPNGRGFLRIVPSDGKGGGPAPSAPTPPTPPAAAAPAASAAPDAATEPSPPTTAPGAPIQLSLFADFPKSTK